MIKAVIDIGSNSIKLAIGQSEKSGLKIIEFLKNVIPIGNSTFLRGVVDQESINRIVTIINGYKKILGDYGLTNAKVIATTAIREANNRDILIDTLKRKTGFDLEVLDVGDVIYYIESYLAYRYQHQFPFYKQNVIMAELGTGSLDISVMESGYTCFNVGFPLGTLRLKQLIDRLEGSDEERYVAVEEYISNEFHSLGQAMLNVKLDDVILIDENYSPYINNLLSGKQNDQNIHCVSRSDVSAMMRKLKKYRVEELIETFNIPDDIAETITAYSVVLDNLCRMSKKRHVHIFEIALSEAVLAHLLHKITVHSKFDRNHQLIHEARFLCRKYNIDLEHAEHVVALASMMFDQLHDFLGLNTKDKIYLILGAYLHDIGLFIHNRAHHKHTEYILCFLNMIRLSDEEKKIIACIGRYHRKNIPRNNHVTFASLPNDSRVLVKKLAAILTLANSLDCSHKQKIKKVRFRMTKGFAYRVEVDTIHNVVLEKADFNNKKKVFEDLTGTALQLFVKEQ